MSDKIKTAIQEDRHEAMGPPADALRDEMIALIDSVLLRCHPLKRDEVDASVDHIARWGFSQRKPGALAVSLDGYTLSAGRFISESVVVGRYPVDLHLFNATLREVLVRGIIGMAIEEDET